MADGLLRYFPPASSGTRVDHTLFYSAGTHIYNAPPKIPSFFTIPSVLQPPSPPSIPPTPTSTTSTTYSTTMAPSTPTKVHFLDPTNNLITALEPLTPPISVPPSPRLPTVDLPPTSSGYCTPTSPEPIESPLQQPVRQQTRIHRSLYQAGNLQFDARMTLQPHLVSLGAAAGRSSPLFEYDTTTLAEAATAPPLPSITLVCENLPWNIRVLSSLPNLFVTNYDVLQAIHVNLRIPVVAAEWFLCGTPQDREVILQTFERRVRRLSNEFSRAEERARSVRRVDCLMGMTRLVRIAPSEDPEVFVIEWGWP